MADEGEAKGRRIAPRTLVKARRAATHGAALLDIVATHRIGGGQARPTAASEAPVGRAGEGPPAPVVGTPAIEMPEPEPTNGPSDRPGGTTAPPRPKRLVRIYRITADAVDHFINDEALMTAAALAFGLILALFPFLIFITALGSILGGPSLAARVSVGLFEVLPSDIAAALQPQVKRVIETRSGGFLTFGLSVTIFSLTTAIESIRAGLNRAYGVREMRNVIITRIESVLFVLIGSLTLLLVAFLAVVAPLFYGTLEDLFPDLVPWRSVFNAIRLGVMGIILFGALLALHVALPAHRRGIKQVWIGCLVTLVLWYLVGLGFSYYLANFGNYAATYAGLAGVVAALMFFYLASACLLFGGEVNRAIAVARRRSALEKRGLAT